MRRATKLKILISTVIVLFVAAYIWHKKVQKESTITGTLQGRHLDEISGIAASGINNDIYYVHNDSGDTSRFFAINPDGELISTIYFNGDNNERFGVRDCEDIAVGPGPDKDKSYVYLGDIGDDASYYDHIAVYRMEEKKAWVDGKANHNAVAAPLYLYYPDGPKDAETLMVDPIEKLIYIVSKRRDTVGVYTTPLLYKADDTVVLTKRCKLFFSGFKPFKWITAGDISKDGTQILLKSYEKVYYWKRKANEPAWQAMQATPQILPYTPEKQGEAIGFTPDGKGYYTTSEGVYSPIYYYRVP